MHFVEHEDILITGGVDGCFLIKIDIMYPHNPAQMHYLDSLGDQIYLKIFMLDQLQNAPGWTKSMRYFTDCDVLMAWSYDQVTIFGLKTNLKL